MSQRGVTADLPHIFPTPITEAPEEASDAAQERLWSEALFRTRTGDPLLTMEVLYQLS
jgi:hypothetical protein